MAATLADKLEDIGEKFISGRKGEHDGTTERLVETSWEKFETEIEPLRNDRNNVNFVYCIVFPAKPKDAGTVEQCKARIVQQERKFSAEDLEDERCKILKHIEEAGFTTEVFYSTTRNEIICKIGSNDGRLLVEADLRDYKLELDPYSLKAILESEDEVTEVDPFTGENATHKRSPIFLDYDHYDKSKYSEFGGPNLFRYKYSSNGVSLDKARRALHQFTRMNPFEHIHAPYVHDWEKRIIKTHGHQVYRTYNDGSILRTADRVTLLMEALAAERTMKGGVKGAGLNLKQMKFEGKILAYFPIQFSQSAQRSGDLTAEALYKKWKYNPSWICGSYFVPWRQPLDDVRDYAGEKIAYYFAFLGFYSTWLIPASIVGLGIFLAQLTNLYEELGTYDFLTSTADIVNKSIDALNSTFSEEALKTRHIALSRDRSIFLYSINPTEVDYIPYYALFIALWATFFLEFWKREQAKLALRWGVSDFEREAETRPEFKSDYFVPSPVTGLPVPYRNRLIFGLKLGTSFSIIASAIGVTIAAFTATYIFKVFMSTSTNLDPLIAPQIALVVNAGAIILLSTIFKKMARVLTEWENHRTDIDFEDNLIGKTFVFSFFNSYTTLFYFAFIKSGNDLPPKAQTQFCITKLEGFQFDDHPELGGAGFDDRELAKIDSCYGAVGYSLAIIFVSQILINNMQEIGIPLLKVTLKDYFSRAKVKANHAKTRLERAAHTVGDAAGSIVKVEAAKNGEEKSDEPDDDIPDRLPLKSPAEHQFILAPYDTPFDDYLEIALQYGYVTLFVAAFPLAPLLALLNNMLELWVDAQKICKLSRRPNLPRAQDIGTWLSIFTYVAYIGVITNSGVLIFTSSSIITVNIDRNDIRVWLFFAFVFSVVCIKFIADFFIADVPTDVTIQLERQKYYMRKVFHVEEDDPDVLPAYVNVDVEAGNGEDEIVTITMEDRERYHPIEQDPFLDYMVQQMMHHMQEEHIDENVVFTKIDVNNNGIISLKELKNFLSKKDGGIGNYLDEFELKLVIDALDMDGDGSISRQEFSAFMQQ